MRASKQNELDCRDTAPLKEVFSNDKNFVQTVKYRGAEEKKKKKEEKSNEKNIRSS